MTIKDQQAHKGSTPAESVGLDKAKRSDGEKKAKPVNKVLAAIKEAARKATEEVIRRRKAAREELARWRKTSEEQSARIAAGADDAGKADEEAAAAEKAARRTARKQKAAEETARWVAESIRALGDRVELNSDDAVSAVQNVCDTLDWKWLKNVIGCQIEYSLDEDFFDSRKEKIKKYADLSELDKKLETGKTYYVRVRLYAVLKDKKEYSERSEVFMLKA